MAKEEEISDAEEEKIEEALKMSEISLILKSYDDIFCIFDPRPYSVRSLSVDFLEEADRASKDKPFENLSLNFLIPKKLRDISKESMIKKRLKEHFKRHFHEYQKEKRGIIWQGISFVILGMIVMFLAVYIMHQYKEESILTNFLVVLFEPAGWFLFWEGFNQIIFESKRVKPKINFYQKMSKSEIDFFTY